LDLNKIVEFADKDGVLQKTRQRRLFHLADIIVSGEKNGPLSPSPKEIGMIVAGFDAALLDSIICRIMGFDEEKIPSVKHALEHTHNGNDHKGIVVGSNNPSFSGKRIDEIDILPEERFEPHLGWEGHIER